MAKEFDAYMAGDDDGTTLRAALRFVAWGGVAACAMAVAMLAARTEVGAQRLAGLLSGPATARADSPVPQTTTAIAARLADPENEAARLRETVKRLTSDRDLVIARLEALERSMDVTASIRDSTPATPPAGTPPLAATPANAPATPAAAPASAPSSQTAPPAAAPVLAVPATPPQPTPATSAAPVRMTKTVPSPAPAPAGAEQTNLGAIAGPASESVATRTEFGVDLGGDRTVDALRTLWNALRTGKHGPLFEGLRPVVAVRDGGKGGGPELRLVVGPLANAGAAARLCGTVAAAGLPCQPTVFDGQRLAVR